MLKIRWQFVAKQGRVAEFEKAYGPEGDWARFFRKGKGFQRTELAKVADRARTYETTDVWDSKGDFERFKHDFAAEYAAIDQRCEDLTEHEAFIEHVETGDRYDR